MNSPFFLIPFFLLSVLFFIACTQHNNVDEHTANSAISGEVTMNTNAVTVAKAAGIQKSTASADRVQWMNWEEVQKAMKTEPRMVFVDIYTDWCGWCKRMDNNTFQKPHIARYLNQHFYNVKFNAEQKEPVVFQGNEFNFVASGRRGYHELAAQLTQGRLSYPTIVFMDEQLRLIQPIPGYQAPENFEPIMTFFAGQHYTTTSWEQYRATYQPMNQ